MSRDLEGVPLPGGICGEAQAECECANLYGHAGPHECACGGSWRWNEQGVFEVIRFPGDAEEVSVMYLPLYRTFKVPISPEILEDMQARAAALRDLAERDPIAALLAWLGFDDEEAADHYALTEELLDSDPKEFLK